MDIDATKFLENYKSRIAILKSKFKFVFQWNEKRYLPKNDEVKFNLF